MSSGRTQWERAHDSVAPARLRATAGAARAAQSAGAVVAVAADPAAAAPHRFPADTAAVRHHAEGGAAAAYAVVADLAAIDARRAGDHRRRGPALESAGRDLDRQGFAGAADRRRLPGGRDLGRPHA